MAASIFARIVAGEIPCHRIYETADVLAFLDINPLSRGHTLLIPKQAAERLEQLDAAQAAALGAALPVVARAVLAATGAAGYNVLQNNGPDAGQEVPHVHFHIIPRTAEDGLGFRWRPTKPGSEELHALAKQIASAVR